MASGELVVSSASEYLSSHYRADGLTAHLAKRIEGLVQPGNVLISGADLSARRAVHRGNIARHACAGGIRLRGRAVRVAFERAASSRGRTGPESPLQKLHRLIRRGRVYTDSVTCGTAASEIKCESADASDGCGNGLFFIVLNADLDRQFEFVQQQWFANSKFADLWDEADPTLGDGAVRSFSMPGCLPVGSRLSNLPQFTTVKGGGYFFLPGLSALRFLAEPEMRGELASPARRAG